MIRLEVDDLTCGHCASTITRAIQGADRDAVVHIDLATHHVTITSAAADRRALGDVDRAAGDPPVPIGAPAVDKQGGFGDKIPPKD